MMYAVGSQTRGLGPRAGTMIRQWTESDLYMGQNIP